MSDSASACRRTGRVCGAVRQIGIHHDPILSPGFLEPVDYSTAKAHLSRPLDELYVGVVPRQAKHFLGGAVGGIVVNDYELVIPAPSRTCRIPLTRVGILGPLVVGGDNDGDQDGTSRHLVLATGLRFV